MKQKIKTLKEIGPILDKMRKKGLKIVQCHGVFDLLHPGHLRHFKKAKEQGDKLVVSVTPDQFVGKGPGRPVFNELLRQETLAAIDCIDYIVLNDSSDAINCIQVIQPDVYVKGKEYQEHVQDVTGKITVEIEAVKKFNGKIFYTDDIVFSSSKLLNRFFDPLPIKIQKFLKELKSKYEVSDLIEKIESLSTMKVLVVGDAIIDVYQYVDPLGQSGKGIHMVASCKDEEVFLGGSLIIANHLAEFTKNVSLLTSIGSNCPYEEFITSTLNPNVTPYFFNSIKRQTLTKKRYVLKDGKTLTKLFETYSSNNSILNEEISERVTQEIKRLAKCFDFVLVSDFGNGFTNSKIIKALGSLPNFLALNTQSNSGNRGYNVVTHYAKADYISINEPEARLAAHDRISPLEEIAKKIQKKMQNKALAITQGVKGLQCFSSGSSIKIPALHSDFVDRVGAGDSFFAVSSLPLAKGYPLDFSSFIGSIAAALDIRIVGNKKSVKKPELLKFLIRLMK